MSTLDRRDIAHYDKTADIAVDVIVPVFNEAAVLERSIERLVEHLTCNFPYTFKITIADNGSTDATWEIAQDLATRFRVVRAKHFDRKGRGYALRASWTMSNARVVAYMDVDLSTDLRAFTPLVAPLLSGHSDVAIGTRLDRLSHVTRGMRREVISRSYNFLLHRLLRVRFTDAQCGFKALTRIAARELLPIIEDNEWFFDTELLVLAERAGLRIYEIPVDWIDDPDSRVEIVRTAASDIRGIMRVHSKLSFKAIRLDGIAKRAGRIPPAPSRNNDCEKQ